MADEQAGTVQGGEAVPSARGSAARPTAKVAVIGAGAVGATLAYAVLTRGAAREVVLHDIDTAKVRAQALDLAHGIQFLPMAHVVGTDDLAACAGADVVVVTAGAKQQPGQSRIDLAGRTVGLVRTLMPRLAAIAPDAVYLMVTNPVDVVTYAALQCSGLPRAQVIGSGTVLDSSRFRLLVAQHVGVAVQNVHAYVVGEHGDTAVPLWSSATVGGVPLLDLEPLDGREPLTAARRDAIAHDVVHAAYEIIAGKGATNYAIGLAGSRVVEAIVDDEHRVMPVSTLVEDFRGIGDVCLSVPTVVSHDGAGPLLPTPMSDDELAALRRSADTLRDIARQTGP
ncbi:L-lactate dehydrogenase [Cellulomonas pakistanensis]|uniref:L-lactate dehydrogenase n=1 Tax=Cellulomonas pakistanensis TaxID=992287 RepID=A0A919U393_9CELL|nr:L-lactate dehydrogenase [Cellulomonas pakistanensis]GIG36953.1 L-lactate dehydrogenase [Cellulomonas pakistanensis]